MLNMNPGLKEITHSITGGAILAQGKPPHCTLREYRREAVEPYHVLT